MKREGRILCEVNKLDWGRERNGKRRERERGWKKEREKRKKKDVVNNVKLESWAKRKKREPENVWRERKKGEGER